MRRHGESGGGQRPAGFIQSADRALRVLEVVGSSEDGVTARAIADRLGLSVSTTYHLLTTLVHAGYVVRLDDQPRYMLGYMIRSLDRALRRQVALHPDVSLSLRETHVRADAPAYLALFRDRRTVIADVADSAQRPRVAQLDVGLHEVPHTTAFGKLMLASMTADQRRALVDEQGLAAMTPSSVTSLPALEEQLAEIRRDGLAVEVDEFMPRLACLAAPVHDAAGRVCGALSVSVRSAELSSRRRTLEPIVRYGARQVSAALYPRRA